MGRFTPVKYIDLSCVYDENKLNVLSRNVLIKLKSLHQMN